MNDKTLVNSRKFSVSPYIIYSLIKAQAGTLGKGILECIMNSVDAGATQVDIVLENQTLTVTDNGKGFQSQAEIEACFEVFGFEHKEGDRTYGAFGIGRAQLWNFCSTVWDTNQFRMDVDIKARGLDYDLSELAQPFAGLRITGSFYEPMLTRDVLACERELKELATYVSIPVTFNGKRISSEPAKAKWTHETADAWILLQPQSSSLTVYNLGVKVRDFPSYQFGCGGLVVTKPGVRCSLNMARNDILVAECAVWKRIRPYLQDKTDEIVRRSPTLTEEQLSNLCMRFLAGEVPLADISSRKVIVDVVGGKHTLKGFVSAWRMTVDQTATWVPKLEAGPSIEQTHQLGHSFVLAAQTLQRFGVRSLGELVAKLGALPGVAREFPFAFLFNARYEPKPLVEEDWTQTCHRIRDGYVEVPKKEWTPREDAAIEALSRAADCLPAVLRAAGVSGDELSSRTLRVGASAVASAWTDGCTTITFERTTLEQLDTGFAGALHLMQVLVHEYLHEGPSSGTHVHDMDFYERFHKAVLYVPGSERRERPVGALAERLVLEYLKACERKKVPVRSKVVTSVSSVERLAFAA